MGRELLIKNLRMILDEKMNIAAMAILIFIVYLLLLFGGHTKYRKLSMKAAVTGILLALSAGAILSLTLLGREYNPYGRNFELEVFWSYKKALFEGAAGLGAEIICNILLFAPWGILLPDVFEKFENPWWMLSSSLIFSGGIELTQGIFRLGLFEFDDIINNVMGAMLGFSIYRMAVRTSGVSIHKH